MKNTIPALLLLAVLLGLCLRTAAVTEDRTRFWQEDLQEADTLIRTEQWAEAQEVLCRSYRSWLSRQDALRVITTHSALNEADCLYRRVIAFTSIREQGELLADLSALDRQLELLALREQLTISNIL